MTDSFIAEARREQIILACIDTLEEVGYNNLSLTKVAKRLRLVPDLFLIILMISFTYESHITIFSCQAT